MTLHGEVDEVTGPADVATTEPQITLTGRVFDALGRPFSDGWISLNFAGQGEPKLAPVQPDESGAYELGPFPVARAGAQARLTVELHGTYGRHVEHVSLPQRPGRVSHDIHLTDLSVLRAQVVDRAGAPIAHAELIWRSDGDYGEHWADETGLLELVGLAPGTLVIEAFAPHGEMFGPVPCRTLVAERTVEVVAGQLVEVELRDRFADRRRVELFLRRPDGTLYMTPNDIIQVWGFEDGAPVAKAKPGHDEDLMFVELPDLEHEVLLVADGSIRHLGKVPRASVQGGEIDLTPQVSTLCGTARDAAGNPLSNEQLVVVWLDAPPHLARLGAGQVAAQTNELGGYCATFLAPGRWTVTTADGIALHGGPFELGAAEVQRRCAEVTETCNRLQFAALAPPSLRLTGGSSQVVEIARAPYRREMRLLGPIRL